MYHLGELGPEGFQELCQALLLSEFPNAQCLPVGQPDGGRDAFWEPRMFHFGSRGDISEKIAFQVKFSKYPEGVKDERDFIENVVKLEKDKVYKLKQYGFSKYYLITNVKGTAHFNKGSIDKVNKELSGIFGVEAYCWWQDDVFRRLDNNSSVKWSYPQILRATDLLQDLVGRFVGGDADRRQSAIKAYITSQYEDDKELKFKQVELQSRMVDLYVDLPVSQEGGRSIGRYRGISSYLEREVTRRHLHVRIGEDDFARGQFNVRIGEDYYAADMFLNNPEGGAFSRVVLEGAPGQGKSTVTQYLCQVMRMKFLNKTFDLDKIPEKHSQSRVRIPFRVDLRDFAKWIEGIDPFQAVDQRLSSSKPRSLEGFLAAQVQGLSGGYEFSVSDLAAVTKVSRVLIALDGFDEVADISIRTNIVEEVSKAIKRLESSCQDVQVIVTSRPAAFAKSVAFSVDDWRYVSLLQLGKQQVDEYADKWMSVRAFNSNERKDFLRVLNSKLKESHTQSLARNPMQLTILLALVHQRGASLPEKRTAMYDAYMDLFFSREAEKSELVKKYRDLLIDIHRYVAWRLHSSAETGADGSIGSLQLRSTLLTYLKKEGEDATIVDDLFDGVVERVGALVSRVQDTYEFEVQPLREYFAARFLYETAPYSPTGSERSGTKLDRLDSLIMNPYWLNVARFYAGCFSKGEVSALVDSLTELASSEGYKWSSHPRFIALTLLGDWVFSQYQPAVKRIISLVFDGEAARLLLARCQVSHEDVFSSLPERCGRDEFIEKAFERMQRDDAWDEQSILARMINENLDLSGRLHLWKSIKGKISNTEWIKIGSELQIFLLLSYEDIKEIISPNVSDYAEVLLSNLRFDILNRSDVLREFLLEAILSKNHNIPALSVLEKEYESDLEAVLAMFSIRQYRIIASSHNGEKGVVFDMLQGHETAHVYDTESRSYRARVKNIHSHQDWMAEYDGEFNTLFAAFREFLGAPLKSIRSEPDVWNKYFSAIVSKFGETASVQNIAIVTAGLRSKSIKGSIGEGFFDQKVNLFDRYRFSRLRSGAHKWWEEQLTSAKDVKQIDEILTFILCWVSVSTLSKLAPTISRQLDQLGHDGQRALVRRLRAVAGHMTGLYTQKASPIDSDILENDDPRIRAIIAIRASQKQRRKCLKTLVRGVEEVDPFSVYLAQLYLFDDIHENTSTDDELVDIGNLVWRNKVSLPWLDGVRLDGLGLEQWFAIASRPSENFPHVIQLADEQVRAHLGEMAKSLHEISNEQCWFDVEDQLI